MPLEDVCKKEQDPYKRAMLKAAVLNLKLQHNHRTNTVQIMKKLGANIVEPKARDEQKEGK